MNRRQSLYQIPDELIVGYLLLEILNVADKAA